MKCRGVRRRLSAFLDDDLPLGDAEAVSHHLSACPSCDWRWRSLKETMSALAGLPSVRRVEGIAASVLDRLEVESRGPGLALLFRPQWAARPLMLRSLVPPLLVVLGLLCGALALERPPATTVTVAPRPTGFEGRLPHAGTEANPLLPSTEVSVPRATRGDPLPERLLVEMSEGTLFLETVIARDGSVSAVTLLDGNSEQAKLLVDALRRERFEPGRFRGRPVAVSVYRLISRMDVRAPIT